MYHVIHLKHHLTTKYRQGESAREYAPWLKDHYLRLGNFDHLTDLVHVSAFHLPPWAENDPWLFFALSEQYERARGRWVSALRCSFPRGISRNDCLVLAERYIETLLPDKPGVWVFHEPVASDGLLNPHAHILFSSRTNDGIERRQEDFFKKHNPKHPAWGGARKDRQMAYDTWRDHAKTLWATFAEDALEAGNPGGQVSPVLAETAMHISVPEALPTLSLEEKFRRRAQALTKKLLGKA